MKIGKLRSLWITVLSALVTANTCGQATIRGLLGAINREWVDKALHLWVKRLLKLVGVTCTVVNPDGVTAVKGKPTIIMCNHTSMYDIPISFVAFPQLSIRMLAKKELSKVPIMGSGMRAAEFPFVDRKNRHQAVKDLEYVSDLMKSGIVIWVAPEGTRSKTGKLAAFKKGAFLTAIDAKATIIPIGIRGAFNILPTKTLRFNINQTAEVHVGQPIDASLYTKDEKDILIEKVHASMKALVGEDG